jgi:hypothetical protein
VHEAITSTWLALTADGRIVELMPDADRASVRATIEVTPEPDHKPWMRHVLRPRLRVSACGRFAAVVHHYGRYGRVVDVARGGPPTVTLDGGTYHSGTVPFLAAFAVVGGRPFLVHRTKWNRLDVSAPQTGELLTGREYETMPEPRQRPPHFLDYFHGRLHVSPGSRAIADDGWVGSPVGRPQVCDMQAWLRGNVWESEDGPSHRWL